jgi:putative Holliday junction resolvase
MKYLGIDWGEKRIGLAVAEDGMDLVLPFKTVSNLKELVEVIKDEEPDCLVLGCPHKMSGEADLNYDFSAFRRRLEEALASLPVKLSLVSYDERLSSKAADIRHGERAGKGDRDQLAAAIILEDYLESLKN